MLLKGDVLLPGPRGVKLEVVLTMLPPVERPLIIPPMGTLGMLFRSAVLANDATKGTLPGVDRTCLTRGEVRDAAMPSLSAGGSDFEQPGELRSLSTPVRSPSEVIG
jgi:hypothetical protein